MFIKSVEKSCSRISNINLFFLHLSTQNCLIVTEKEIKHIIFSIVSFYFQSINII